MEALNSVFNSIEGFEPSHHAVIIEALCLWIWHADKVPPHVGLSFQGKYYSLKVKGKDWQVPVYRVVEAIDKKNIPSLCLVISHAAHDPSILFEGYQRAEAGKITCLYPIREYFELPEVSQLSELLAHLTEVKKIQRIFGFHLPENYSGIPSYGLQHIHARLEQLTHG